MPIGQGVTFSGRENSPLLQACSSSMSHILNITGDSFTGTWTGTWSLRKRGFEKITCLITVSIAMSGYHFFQGKKKRKGGCLGASEVGTLWWNEALQVKAVRWNLLTPCARWLYNYRPQPPAANWPKYSHGRSVNVVHILQSASGYQAKKLSLLQAYGAVTLNWLQYPLTQVKGPDETTEKH